MITDGIASTDKVSIGATMIFMTDVNQCVGNQRSQVQRSRLSEFDFDFIWKRSA